MLFWVSPCLLRVYWESWKPSGLLGWIAFNLYVHSNAASLQVPTGCVAGWQCISTLYLSQMLASVIVAQILWISSPSWNMRRVAFKSNFVQAGVPLMYPSMLSWCLWKKGGNVCSFFIPPLITVAFCQYFTFPFGNKWYSHLCSSSGYCFLWS